jgi:hypothetical protein
LLGKLAQLFHPSSVGVDGAFQPSSVGVDGAIVHLSVPFDNVNSSSLQQRIREEGSRKVPSRGRWKTVLGRVQS